MQAELESLYSPLLDPALIAAIAGDVDNIDDAKGTLDALYAEAIADGHEGPELSDADALAIQELSLTEPSVSTPQSIPSEEGDELSQDEDLKFLRLSFPDQNLMTLKFVLKKSGRDVIRAVDELLNRETLEREQELDAILDGTGSHAIDAFFTDGQPNSRHKGQQKKMRQRRDKALADVLEHDAGLPKLSKWDQINRDVDWLCRILPVERSVAQSAYHRTTHLGAALDELVANSPSPGHALHPDREDNAAKLLKSYRALGVDKIDQLLNLTNDDLTLATEAAQVLSSWRPYEVVGLATQSGTATPRSAAERAAAATSDGGLSIGCGPIVQTAAEYRALAHDYALKRDAYYAQASKAHGENKSSMAGVALHYAERGREQDVKMRVYQMKAARAQGQASVMAPSSGQNPHSEVDLHGLTVQEAVDVAREQASQWWTRVRLSEDSATAQQSLRLITGKGLHSSGGKAKIYPAVRAMLEREGWRVEPGTGVLIVRGIARH